MTSPLGKYLLKTIAVGLLISLLLNPLQDTLAMSGSYNARGQPFVEPFLYPPFPGTASEESVFDHANPNLTVNDSRIVVYTGDSAKSECPSPDPLSIFPPQEGFCDGGSAIYWSGSFGEWIGYNGNNGTDFGMSYRPVYAAADSDQVVFAGWHDPMNHSHGLGLYVVLHHSNGYLTYYGHLSSIAVPSCTYPGCANLKHGEIVGYSGSTGNAGGAYLHFRVVNPEGRAVDPYGWIGEYPDPWPYNQSNSLWVQYPSLQPKFGSTALVLPTHDPFSFPASVTTGTIVDDSDPGFSESPADCWTIADTLNDQSENNNMHYINTIIETPATCTARWEFPDSLRADVYAVYVRIPAMHTSSESAIYTVVHSGQASIVYVNQAVFTNPYYVTNGWVYIGQYEFSGNGDEYVSLPNTTQDTLGKYQTLMLGADAIRFISVGEIPPTSTPGSSLTPTRRRTPTPNITPTYTLTQTITPTISTTPTLTRTLTPTRSQTVTSTSSTTPTP